MGLGRPYVKWWQLQLVVPLLLFGAFVASRFVSGGAKVFLCVEPTEVLEVSVDGAVAKLEVEGVRRSLELSPGRHAVVVSSKGLARTSYALEMGRWSDVLIAWDPAECFVQLLRDPTPRIVGRFPSARPVDVPNGAAVCPTVPSSSPTAIVPVECDELALPDSELLSSLGR